MQKKNDYLLPPQEITQQAVNRKKIGGLDTNMPCVSTTYIVSTAS